MTTAIEKCGCDQSGTPSSAPTRPDPAPHSAAGYRLLTSTREGARQAIEANALRLSLELVDLQRKAIDSVHEAAIVTLQLAEAVSRASGPTEAAEAYLKHGRERTVALNGVALEFFRSALNMMGALSLSGVGLPPDRDLAAAGPENAETDLAKRVAELTARQRRVLTLLLCGLPNKLIAHELGICETTVKAHVSQVLLKFHVYSRARIIAMFGRIGDIEGLD